MKPAKAAHTELRTAMKLRLLASALLLSASPLFGQGRLIFNNSEYAFGPSPVTIGNLGALGEGPVGAYLGADYTASLYYLAGAGYTAATFDASNPLSFPSADTPFFGVTGFPTGNFTMPRPGLFDGGTVTLPLTGPATVQVRVWYNVGATSFEDAKNKGFNVGESNPLTLNLLEPPFVPEKLNDAGPGIIPFTVQPVPEPSVLVLMLLSLSGFLLHRIRR
jgi:hypothetical protein